MLAYQGNGISIGPSGPTKWRLHTYAITCKTFSKLVTRSTLNLTVAELLKLPIEEQCGSQRKYQLTRKTFHLLLSGNLVSDIKWNISFVKKTTDGVFENIFKIY